MVKTPEERLAMLEKRGRSGATPSTGVVTPRGGRSPSGERSRRVSTTAARLQTRALERLEDEERGIVEPRSRNRQLKGKRSRSFRAPLPQAKSTTSTKFMWKPRRMEGNQTPVMIESLRYLPGEQKVPLIQLSEGRKVRQVAAGSDHTLALTDDKVLWAWGANSRGQLGVGHTSSCFDPQPVPILSGKNVTQIACGPQHSVAVTAQGIVFSWGAWEACGHGRDRITIAKRAAAQGDAGRRADMAKSTGFTLSTESYLEQDKQAASIMAEAAFAGDSTVENWKGPKLTRSAAQRMRKHGGARTRETAASSVVPMVREQLKTSTTPLKRFDYSGRKVKKSELGKYAGAGNAPGQLTDNVIHPDVMVDTLEPRQIRVLRTQMVKKVQCGWGFSVALTLQGRVFSWGNNTRG